MTRAEAGAEVQRQEEIAEKNIRWERWAMEAGAPWQEVLEYRRAAFAALDARAAAVWAAAKEAADRRREAVRLAAEHLTGIEGGLAGAVRDYRAGASLEKAAGLGDSWDLPTGVDLGDVLAEVERQLREAAAE